MLKIYCQRQNEEPRLASNAFGWDEAIQFIRILVSVHGYNWEDIRQYDDGETQYTLFDGYAPDEYCYIVQEKE